MSTPLSLRSSSFLANHDSSPVSSVGSISNIPASLPPASPLRVAASSKARSPLSPSITLRDATKDDAMAMNNLYNSVIQEKTLLDWAVERPLEERIEWLEIMIGQDHPVVLAFESDELVGFGALEPYDMVSRDVCFFYLARIQMVVRPSHRKKHIGTALWQALVEHEFTRKRTIHTVFIKLLSCNIPGIKAVQSFGFKHVGTLDKVAVVQGRLVDQCFFHIQLPYTPDISDVGMTPRKLLTIRPPSSENVNAKPNITCRDATLADLPALREVFNEVIANTLALEYYSERTLEERTEWFQSVTEAGYPVMLAEEDGVPIGYMCLDPYGEKDQVYPYTAFISAFLTPSARRRKVGEFLYKQFIRHPAIAKKNIHADVHCVNSAGINSSLKAGFKHCCTATRFDVKNGEWLDVAWLRKEIGSPPNIEVIELERQFQTLQGGRL